MAAMGFAELPRRLVLEVPVPKRLSDMSINQTCEMAASRLRHLLSVEFQRRSAARLQQRLDARADRRRARMDTAIRATEAAEAAEAKGPARQPGS